MPRSVESRYALYVPTRDEALIARAAAERLRPFAGHHADVEVRLAGTDDTAIRVPASAVSVIEHLLAMVGERHAIAVSRPVAMRQIRPAPPLS
jgi:hypothetical protein